MRVRIAIALGLGLAAACSDGGTGPERKSNETGGGSTQATASVAGIVYGFTTVPDSQRVELSGATVTLIRVGDLPPADPGTGQPPDSTRTNSSVLFASADSVLPPDNPGNPPPAACSEGTVVATSLTGSDGTWQAAGLEEGLFNVRVDAPEGSQYRGVEYCGYAVRGDLDNRLTLYLPVGP
jgi:hypothetical protein